MFVGVDNLGPEGLLAITLQYWDKGVEEHLVATQGVQERQWAFISYG